MYVCIYGISWEKNFWTETKDCCNILLLFVLQEYAIDISDVAADIYHDDGVKTLEL